MRREANSPALKASELAVTMARWALVLTIITLPWRQHVMLMARPFPPIYANFTDLRLDTYQIFLLALLLLWGVSLLFQPRRLRVGPFFIWWPLLGLVLAAVGSTITAVDPLLSAYHAAQLVTLAGLYLFVVNEIKGLDLIAAGAAGQILIQAVVGIGQAWQQHDLGLGWLGERYLDPMGDSSFVWAQGALRSLQAYGLSDHPNIMAAGLVFSLLLLLAWYFTTESRWRAAAVVVFGLGVLALFLTFSRPAWIALAGGLVGTAVFLQRHDTDREEHGWLSVAEPSVFPPIRVPFSWLPLVGVAALLLLPAIGLRLPYLRFGTETEIIAVRLQERINTQQERAALNRAANDQFSSHALTGVGLGGMPLALRAAGFGYDNQPARVTLITAAAETGLFGALFYLAALAVPWLILFLRPGRLGANPTLAGLYGLLLALIIFSFYDVYLWSYSAGRLWQWLAWSLWAAAFTDYCF